MSKNSPEELELAHNEIARAYVESILQLMALSGQDEVNFLKKSIETPNGGTYILQFQHVSGPKISLKELYPTHTKEAANEEDQSNQAK